MRLSIEKAKKVGWWPKLNSYESVRRTVVGLLEQKTF